MFERKPHWTPFGFLRTKDGAGRNHPSIEHAGISGFLLLPLLMLTAWSGGGVYALAKAIPYLPQMLWDAIGHDWITPLRILTAIALVGFSIFCLVEFVQRRRAAPTLLIVFFGMLIGISAIVAIWHPLHLFLFTGVLAAVSAGEIAYFLKSSRVKKTFVR